MSYLYAENKEELINRLRRIEGQVRGLARMVEEDKYCVDILTQVSAVSGALERVGLALLGDHVRGCVTEAVAAGDGEAKIAELMTVIERFSKA